MNKVTHDTVRLANGQEQISSEILPHQRFRVGTYKDHTTFHFTKLQGFDMILGKPWLAQVNPYIDWRKNTIKFKHGGKQHTIVAGPRQERDPRSPIYS